MTPNLRVNFFPRNFLGSINKGHERYRQRDDMKDIDRNWTNFCANHLNHLFYKVKQATFIRVHLLYIYIYIYILSYSIIDCFKKGIRIYIYSITITNLIILSEFLIGVTPTMLYFSFLTIIYVYNKKIMSHK